jgi:preprotein translocase subunit SecG
MIAVLLTIHVIIVLALVGVVLMQRSEGGGALGMGSGGGGGGGGLMTGRGAANALTRATTILAALFFVSSLSLAVVTDRLTESEAERAERLTGQENLTTDEIDTGDLLDVFDNAIDNSKTPPAGDELVLDPEEAPAENTPEAEGDNPQ